MRDFGVMSWPFESAEPSNKPAHGAEFPRGKRNMGRAGSDLR